MIMLEFVYDYEDLLKILYPHICEEFKKEFGFDLPYDLESLDALDTEVRLADGMVNEDGSASLDRDIGRNLLMKVRFGAEDLKE